MAERLSKPIELFYPGTHTDFRRKVVTIGKAALEKSVAWFNSNNQRLPLVVGHPDNENDHFGVATKLELQGDRVVIAEVEGLDRSFQKIVNSGELPRVSAKIRLEGHPSNLSDGIEFQHAGFFGKSRVALDKLKEASFSEFDNLEFYFMDTKKKKVEDDEEESMDEEMNESDADEKAEDKKKKKSAEYAAFEAEKLEFQKQVASFKRAREIEPVVENWVREGKIAPVRKSGLIAIFAALPNDLEVEFSNGGDTEVTQSASEYLVEFMDSLPKSIDYSEVSAVTNEPIAKTATFAMNQDGQLVNVVDPQMDAYNQILASGVDVSDSNAFVKALNNLGG